MKRLEAKHPLAIRLFHWINFPVLFVMIWSGLLILFFVVHIEEVIRAGWNNFRAMVTGYEIVVDDGENGHG